MIGICSNARSDAPALQAFGERMGAILEMPMPMDEHTRELSPCLLAIAPEADKPLVVFSNPIEAKQAHCGDYGNVTGYASKAAEQAARIAGVLAL